MQERSQRKAEMVERLGGRFHLMVLISWWPGIHGTNKGQNVKSEQDIMAA